MSFVLDCSAACCWCFDDEASRGSAELLLALKVYGAVVPIHWPLEVANTLLNAERRGRIQVSTVEERLDLLRELPINVEATTTESAWRQTLTLARANRLTSYDAAYLELAIRLRLPLATKDRQLVAAATRNRVEILAV